MLNLDWEFKELQESVVKRFLEINKRAGKTVNPVDIVQISAQVSALAIQEYHRQFHSKEQENQ